MPIGILIVVLLHYCCSAIGIVIVVLLIGRSNSVHLHCCSAIGIVIVVLLIGRRCTLVLCYRYSDSSITNR